MGVDGEGQGSRLSSKEGKNEQGTARSQPYREGISPREGWHQGHPGGRSTRLLRLKGHQSPGEEGDLEPLRAQDQLRAGDPDPSRPGSGEWRCS